MLEVGAYLKQRETEWELVGSAYLVTNCYLQLLSSIIITLAVESSEIFTIIIIIFQFFIILTLSKAEIFF